MKRIKSFLVPITLRYLRAVARLALRHTHATVIGIAGSVGKTSTREALYAILKDIAPTHMVAGNSETGVPLGLVGLFPRDYSPLDWLRMIIVSPFRIGFLRRMRYVIVEMGIDDPYPPKNMGYLLTIVQPHIGVITEESAAHTMQFEKILGPEPLSDDQRLQRLVEAITREDAKMLSGAQHRIINNDNPYLKTLKTAKTLTFGRARGDNIRITGYDVDIHKTTFSYTLGDTPIDLQFKGYAFPEDLASVFAAALLAAHALNIPLDTAISLLEKNFVPPRGREGLFAAKHNAVIIDSSYNASRQSVLSFLALTNQLKKQTRRHTIVVLADMLELGNEAQIEHEAVARAVTSVADSLFLVGPLTKRFILPIVEKKIPDVRWFPSVIELNDALAHIPSRSLLLFKGSQGELWLEESIKLLLRDPRDVARLPRQNEFWKKVKTAVGRWIEV